MVLSSIIMLAWLVKPLIGYLIDHFLNKRIWIFIALAFDIILVLAVGLLQLPIFLLIAILMLNSANAAFRDVAVDGVMCVEGKKYRATGKIQSVQWISISVAGILTGIGGGVVAEKWGYQAGYLFLVPVYLLVSLPAYFYQEKDYMSIKQGESTLLIDLKKLFTSKNLLIVALFIFLYRFSPSFGTPLFFIQRDSFKWGKVWIGVLGSIGTVFGIFGSLLYYKFSRK